jgi:hypothetical protein
MYLYQAQRAEKEMPGYQDYANQVKRENGPETADSQVKNQSKQE